MIRRLPHRFALVATCMLFTLYGCHSAENTPTGAPPAKAAMSAAPAIETDPPAPLSADEKAQIGVARGLSTAFSAIARQVSPAVVYIEVSKRQIMVNGQMQSPQESNPDPFQGFFDNPMLPPQFRQHFFQMMPQQNPNAKRYSVQQPYAAGSGVIFDNDGHILTNYHVVKGSDMIKVRLMDKRVFTAKLIGTDPHTDLAVLQIQGQHLHAAQLGDSNTMQVGDWVLALGNPFGLDHTVTAGIVSGIGRSNFQGLSDYQQYIQTDAAINSGNSGGPLVNLDGQVIGINTWIIAPGGGNVGLGFAIPSNMAKEVANQLIAHGVVQRGWLGVEIQEVTPDLATAFGLQKVGGALVSKVEKNTPAGDAGIKAGDVILSVNGTDIPDINTLRVLIASLPAGQAVPMTVWRDNAAKTLSVNIGKQPSSVLANGAKPDDQNGMNDLQENQQTTPSVNKPGDIGVKLGEMSDRLADQLGFGGKAGVLVRDVIPGSPAYLAGLQAGDLIQAIDRQPVTSLDDAKRILTATRQAKKQSLLMKVLRNDGKSVAPLFLVVKPYEGMAPQDNAGNQALDF
ncbi:MAG: Do family serine endopeptidase [Planctomycetota bacterium]